MSSNADKAEDISASLIYIKEQLRMLRKERDKLFEANGELVSLALELEEMFLEERGVQAEVGDISLDDSSHSSEESWRSEGISHESTEELQNDAKEDIEKIEAQISTVKRTLSTLQDLKASNNSI